MKQYLRMLETFLQPVYVPPYVIGGHDVEHVWDIINLYPDLSRIYRVDSDEYIALAWLHNVDRCFPFRKEIKRLGVFNFVMNLLSTSSFDLQTQSVIADAVKQHDKRDNEEGDSDHLSILRAADKLVRLCFKNFQAGMQHWSDHPLYDPNFPLDYQVADKNCLWVRFMWNFEWIGMLPNDDVRNIIYVPDLRRFADAVRLFGEDIAMENNLSPDLVEEEIRTAAGDYYYMVAPD